MGGEVGCVYLSYGCFFVVFAAFRVLMINVKMLTISAQIVDNKLDNANIRLAVENICIIINRK